MAASRPEIPPGSGITTIPLPTPFAVGRVNCYLVEADPPVLIDPGPRSADAYAELEAGLAAHGLVIGDVGLVMVTHQHMDHIGMAGAVAERAGAEVACIGPLADILADVETRAGGRRRLPGRRDAAERRRRGDGPHAARDHGLLPALRDLARR